MPRFRHSVVSYWATRIISDFVEAKKLGWVAINDTFVKTTVDPPVVRGADLLFVSYAKLPAGPTPEDLSVPPDLVVEVRSPSDRWSEVFAKIAEYLKAGVTVVIILDPHTATASVYREDEFQQVFDNGDELVVPDVLPGFAIPVKKFFEE